MDSKDKDLLVEIFAGKSDEEGEIATGYPIAKNRILTAGHALFTDDNESHPIQVRWHHLKNSPAREWRPGSVIWSGNSKFDIAVVDCDFPDEVDHWGYLSDEALRQNKDWASEGFARAGKRDSGRMPVPVGGTAYAPATASLEFVLGNDDPVSGEDNWNGASGSPVFHGETVLYKVT